MSTKEKYEAELDNIKRDLQRMLIGLEDIIELTEREDIETAYERACEHFIHQAGQATEQLRKVRRLDREVQEERGNQ
jgi:hypothetical protein